jgi:hypothetical protein
MKKIILVITVAVILVLSLIVPVFAGGDQVRGEKGQGNVNQEQITDPPPFQP